MKKIVLLFVLALLALPSAGWGQEADVPDDASFWNSKPYSERHSIVFSYFLGLKAGCTFADLRAEALFGSDPMYTPRLVYKLCLEAFEGEDYNAIFLYTISLLDDTYAKARYAKVSIVESLPAAMSCASGYVSEEGYWGFIEDLYKKAMASTSGTGGDSFIDLMNQNAHDLIGQ